MSKITIIIRPTEYLDCLSKLLASVNSQKNIEFDLITYDKYYTDKNYEILEEYKVHLIENNFTNGNDDSHLLNLIISNYSNSIIVFLEPSNILINEYSIFNLIKQLRSEEASIVFGRKITFPNAKTWLKRDFEHAYPEDGEPAAWVGFSFSFSAILKKCWDEHHFNNDSGILPEYEWGYWANNNNIFISYVPKAISLHFVNQSFSSLYQNRRKEGQMDIEIRKKYIGFKDLVKLFIKSFFKDLICYTVRRDFIGLLTVPMKNIVTTIGYFSGVRDAKKKLLKL